VAQIEWRCAAELSQDKVMLKEIQTGTDAHAMNCTDLMELPLTKDNRQDAKITSFRLIYGGSPYAFYMDPKMPNFSMKKWERIVENFYKKYSGLALQQDKWVQLVYTQGFIQLPSGRKLYPQKKEKNGVWDYSRPTIVNYPVQAYATADIMPLAMAIIDHRLKQIGAYDAGNLFINQVHDSVVFDTITDKWATWIGHLGVHVFRQLPEIIVKKLMWQTKWSAPLDGDFCVGPSWGAVKSGEIQPELMARLDARFSIDNIPNFMVH
jgi:DNA polymerase I-like protein with 3'-5' exonuclease and polymerase domains